MFTPEQIKILTRASTDFPYFVDKIFSQSMKNFIRGEHVDNTARFLSLNNKTIRVSARHHFKSFSFYAHFMWKLMFIGSSSTIEAHYFSFNSDLAGYHIGKIKNCIELNPFFSDIIDKKPTAESVLRYTWDNKHYTTLSPHGLIQFKRGIHGDIIYVDDPFQDPDNELNPTMIFKINEIFKSNILDMPKEPDGELHVAGTPQTKDDFFFDTNTTKRFATSVLPAIYTDPMTNEEKALWPEWMDLEELYRKREERTERIFKREYLCTPVYSTKSFFSKEKLFNTVVNPNLSNLNTRSKYITNGLVVAGFDIGKKSHPSHLSVFDYTDNKMIMIHQKFMDGWAYSNGKNAFYEQFPSQLEYLKKCIEMFGIKELRYDNTRGEFESLSDQNLVPKEMVPIVFNTKMKVSGSTAFERLVEKKQMEIQNEHRLLDQICSVMDDLNAITTPLGHGDSFWSIVLAIMCIKELVGFEDENTDKSKNRRTIQAGQPSIFSENQSIPRGF